MLALPLPKGGGIDLHAVAGHEIAIGGVREAAEAQSKQQSGRRKRSLVHGSPEVGPVGMEDVRSGVTGPGTLEGGSEGYWGHSAAASNSI